MYRWKIFKKTKNVRKKYALKGYQKFERDKMKIVKFFSYKHKFSYSLFKEIYFDIFFYYKKLIRIIILIFKR